MVSLQLILLHKLEIYRYQLQLQIEIIVKFANDQIKPKGILITIKWIEKIPVIRVELIPSGIFSLTQQKVKILIEPY